MEGARQRALLALWAVPGIGPKTLERISQRVNGAFEDLLQPRVSQWLGDVEVSPQSRACLTQVETLERVADVVLHRIRRARVKVAFAGDPAFPNRLVGLEDAPPLLFYRGTPGGPRRRVAMVGTRHPDGGFSTYAENFARQVAQSGIGIVSGAAQGIDQACHRGATALGLETWAFVGSSLDQLDTSQAKVLPTVLDAGGMFFSELPPGVRASRTTFPRRNRLISGASDLVVVLRAGSPSGALLTAEFAEKQGRPVLALPGDASNSAAVGCNQLIAEGRAQICRGPSDVWELLRIPREQLMASMRAAESFGEDGLSDEARTALAALPRVPTSFEVVLDASRLSSAALTSALCELELSGLAIQHPGKRYERL